MALKEAWEMIVSTLPLLAGAAVQARACWQRPSVAPHVGRALRVRARSLAYGEVLTLRFMKYKVKKE